jgi:hypothetical protein
LTEIANVITFNKLKGMTVKRYKKYGKNSIDTTKEINIKTEYLSTKNQLKKVDMRALGVL